MFLFRFFVHIVNARIATKLIFCSINVYLHMDGSGSRHQEIAC
jgi:hypothetical protein